MGIAYPTLTNDGMMRPDGGKVNPRADSFSLYCNWVANRVLMNILPKTLLDNKLHVTMRNNRKKAIENNKSNNNNNLSAGNSPSKTAKKPLEKVKQVAKNISNTVKKDKSSKVDGLLHHPKPDLGKTLSPIKLKTTEKSILRDTDDNSPENRNKDASSRLEHPSGED